MKRVLIIYIKGGGGHISLANSAKAIIQKNFPDAIVELFDPFPAFYTELYGKFSVNLKSLYKIQYKISDCPYVTSSIHKINYKLSKSRLQSKFKSFKPDLIITNSSLATKDIELALAETETRAKFVVHVADPFSLHESWYSSKKADLYLVSNQASYDKMAFAGIPKDCIKLQPFLLRDQFYNNQVPKKTLFDLLNISKEKKLVFIGGAGQGMKNLAELVELLVENRSVLREKMHFVVNVGNNTQLVRRVFRIVRNHSDFITFIPLIKNLAPFLYASDIAIGKGGPNFVFEALFTNNALFLIDWIPGQEDGTIDFVQNNKLALVLTPNELINHLINFVSREDFINDFLNKTNTDLLRNELGNGPATFAQTISLL